MTPFLDMHLVDIHTHLPRRHSILSAYRGEHSPETLKQATYLSVGIHPWYIQDEADMEAQLRWIEQQLEQSPVVALGECGLDKRCATPFALQQQAFLRIIELSERHRLPLILHVVGAEAELLAMKKKTRPTQSWIIHGFRGKAPQALTFLRHGLSLSFGERYAVEALRAVPLPRLFLETDTSTADISTIMKNVARDLSLPADELHRHIQQNIAQTFPKCQKVK